MPERCTDTGAGENDWLETLFDISRWERDGDQAQGESHDLGGEKNPENLSLIHISEPTRPY